MSEKEPPKPPNPRVSDLRVIAQELENPINAELTLLEIAHRIVDALWLSQASRPWWVGGVQFTESGLVLLEGLHSTQNAAIKGALKTARDLHPAKFRVDAWRMFPTTMDGTEMLHDSCPHCGGPYKDNLRVSPTNLIRHRCGCEDELVFSTTGDVIPRQVKECGEHG